jgi:hypothetical protein
LKRKISDLIETRTRDFPARSIVPLGAQVIQNHENSHIQKSGQDEVSHRKYKGLKLGGGQAYNLSSN